MPDGSAASGEQASVSNGGWIVGPRYDSVMFIGAPVLWLVIAVVVWGSGYSEAMFAFGGGEHYVFPAFALTFSMAHVVAVLFRSHANPSIFPLHPVRFLVVPAALLALFIASRTAFLFGLVFAVWFDNWHSSLQTFGLGRIYDMRAGNDANVGRRLDIGLALVTFLGPILAGVTLASGLGDFHRFDEVGLAALTRIPGWVLAHQLWLTVPIVVGGLAYVVFYVHSYARLAKQGYRVSKQKVALWVCLALVSLYTWGFDSFGQAFLIMECFHALQYFALVWWSEKKSMQRVFRLERAPLGRVLTLALFLGSTIAFGLWVSLFGTSHWELSLFLVVEILHYWYDGFIWSVRKRQV